MTRKKPSNPATFADLGGTTHKLLRFPDKDNKFWSAFNPSLIFTDKYGYVCLIRSSNYYYSDLGNISLTTENRVRNKLYLARLNENLEVISLNQITYLDGPEQVRGNEDGRLFERDGELYFHIVLREEHSKTPRLVVYKLDPDTYTATFVKKHDSGQYQSVEKNWMLPSKAENSNFEFIYDTQFVVKKDKPLVRVKQSNPKTDNLRGGSNLLSLDDGSYLSVCHFTYHTSTKGFVPSTFSYTYGSRRDYTHVFTRFDNKGCVTHISDEFVFDKLHIEFACGLENYGSKFAISYGVNDQSAKIAIIEKSKVLELLEEI